MLLPSRISALFESGGRLRPAFVVDDSFVSSLIQFSNERFRRIAGLRAAVVSFSDRTDLRLVGVCDALPFDSCCLIPQRTPIFE